MVQYLESRIMGGIRAVRRTYIFIDGGYLRSCIKQIITKNFGYEESFADKFVWDPNEYASVIDYLKNLGLGFGFYPERLIYYDGIISPKNNYDEYDKKWTFFNNLKEVIKRVPFDVKLGELVPSSKGYLKQKGVDVLIAIDMITKAYLDHYDVALLCAGDRDFKPLVIAVKEYTGKRVGCIQISPESTSDDLVKACDHVIHVFNIQKILKDNLKKYLENYYAKNATNREENKA